MRGRTQSGGSNPTTQSIQSDASLKQKENHHVPREKKNDHIIRLLKQTQRERELMSNHQHKRERERERERENTTATQKNTHKAVQHHDKKMIQRERDRIIHSSKQNKKRETEDAPHHQNKRREHALSNKTHTKSFIFKAKSELLSQQPDGGPEPTAAKQKKQCCSPPREIRMIISFHYQHKERKR